MRKSPLNYLSKRLSQKRRQGRYFVRYFNGFSLSGEEELFSPFIDSGDFTIAGFSYGAQRAFEKAYSSSRRVERLILLSPAFFQEESRAFVRTQLRYFNSDNQKYIEQFLTNSRYPSDIDLTPYMTIGTKDALESLLTYRWDRQKIETLLDRGTKIEVYIGGRDKIISSSKAYEFFSSLTTTYLIKKASHCLV
jgi:pimeloyl-ACP methyl ester carboxylesterase